MGQSHIVKVQYTACATDNIAEHPKLLSIFGPAFQETTP